MHELDKILKLWTEAESAGQPAVLATVVKTCGSAYRLPGARLLLLADGRRAGSVSGGCLEDDLLKKAWWLTESGPIVKRYDTTPEGEISSGYGLGCSGIIYVFLERLTSDAPTLKLIRKVRSERRPATITHPISPPDELFIETVTPPVRLLVFGAGDDAVPLTNLAKLLGWNVCVLDGRSHYARPEKFPQADEVLVWSPERGALSVDPWTVAVLMTHSYTQDLQLLRHLSSQPLPYLGLLGPRSRSSQLLSEAGLNSTNFSSLHTPMGLDIGADGPEQVALSVVAEIQAILNKRDGGPLRNRPGSIHSPEQQSLCIESLA